MSLLVLNYHRARAGPGGNPARMLNAHFAYIACCHANRMPGEPLAPGMLNVCLSFDMGFYDFYQVAYPLLIQHNLRALLAVSPDCPRAETRPRPGDRLTIEEDDFTDPDADDLCTWSELRRMAASGHVTLAALASTRTASDAEAGIEMDAARSQLAERLREPVECLVFADGAASMQAWHAARRRFRFVFGNGDASNREWDQPILYRINSDELSSPVAPFSSMRRARYGSRFWWNRARDRANGFTVAIKSPAEMDPAGLGVERGADQNLYSRPAVYLRPE